MQVILCKPGQDTPELCLPILDCSADNNMQQMSLWKKVRTLPTARVTLPRYDLFFSRKLVYSQDFIPLDLVIGMKRTGITRL